MDQKDGVNALPAAADNVLRRLFYAFIRVLDHNDIALLHSLKQPSPVAAVHQKFLSQVQDTFQAKTYLIKGKYSSAASAFNDTCHIIRGLFSGGPLSCNSFFFYSVNTVQHLRSLSESVIFLKIR